MRPAAAATLAAAAALTLAFLPRAPRPSISPVAVSESYDVPALSVTCSPGELSACPSGSKLVVSLAPGRPSAFLSAYAEPLGSHAEPVFYFSKEEESPKLPAETATRPLALRPGRYRIHAVLADRPLARAELLDASAGRADAVALRAKAQVEIVVTE